MLVSQGVKIALMLVVMLSVASAFLPYNCDEHTKSYLRMEETGGTDFADECPTSVGNNNGTRGTGTFGQGYDDTLGASGHTGLQIDIEVTNKTALLSYSQLTIDVFFNITDNTTLQGILSTGGNNMEIAYDGNSLESQIRIGGVTETISGDHVLDDTYIHFALQYNGTHVEGWREVDGIMIRDGTPNAASGVVENLNPGDVFCIGSRTNSRTACDVHFLTGTVDELRISTIARYPGPAEGSVADVTDINVTNISPSDDEVNNTSPTVFSYLYAGRLNDAHVTDVHLYFNGSIEQTNTSVIPDANASSFSNAFTAATEEEVDWFISVQVNNTDQFNSTELTFFWDDISPIITHTFPLNSTPTMFGPNVTISGSVSDSNLHNINITVKNSTGDVVFNETNYTAISPQFYREEVSFNLFNGGGTGTYTLIIEAADDHNAISTKSKIKPQPSQLVKDLDKKKFTLRNNIWNIDIELLSNQKIVDVETEFTNDAQHFNIITDSTGNTEKKYDLRVYGYGFEEIESDHLGHLLKLNQFYIDFDGIEGDVKTKCYDDYCDIEIKTDKNKLNIKSIGGVNVVEEVVVFELNNEPAHLETLGPGQSSLVLETKTYVMNVSIDLNQTGNVSNFTFWLNNTPYSPTVVNSSNFYEVTVDVLTPNISANLHQFLFNWSFDLDYINGSSEFFVTPSRVLTVGRIQLTQCGDISNVTSLTILLRDEQTDAFVNGTYKATFTLFGTVVQNNVSVSFENNGKYNHTFCIFPTFADVRVDSFEEYSNETFGTRYYFLDFFNATNVTTVINHYFVNNTNTNEVKVIVLDQANQRISDGLVYFFRYFPETNTFKNTAMVKTGIAGDGSTFLDTNIVYYRVSVYKDRKLISTFPSQVIPCQLAPCEIELFVVPTEQGEFWQIFDEYLAVCTNTTTLITCAIVDDSKNLKSVDLQLIKSNINGAVTVCHNNETAVGNQATVSCPIPQSNGTYTYYFRAHFAELIPVFSDVFNIGEDGAFFNVGLPISALFLLTMFGLFRKNPALLVVITLLTMSMNELVGITAFGWIAIGGSWILGFLTLYLIERRKPQ